MISVKDLLREEFKKVWGNDSHMVDWCANNVATVAVLPDGKLVTVEKHTIKKDFCFGESGYDYDDAQKMAEHARKSEDYFREKNMEFFNKWVGDLEKVLEGDPEYRLIIYPKTYNGQTDDCKLASISFVRLGEIIEACGGSVYLDELEGKEINYRGNDVRIATAKEITAILNAYFEAMKMHEKKVNSYLKRYGTSKVHSWTYWRDA